MIDVEARKGHVPRARIEVHKQFGAGPQPEQLWAHEGDTLEELSGGRALYAGLEIGYLDAGAKTMQLMLPGDIRPMSRGETYGDATGDSLAAAMIARTIEHHFRTELRNRPIGIQTLSLLFVPSVADYRVYTDDGPKMPDILSELASRTNLPRKIVAQILIQSDRLDWARDNPSAFVELAHKAIALARRDVLTQGVTYEKTGEHFDQTLFEPFEADANDLVPVDRGPMTFVRVDSKTIERPIAETLDQAEPVAVFAKLPPDFKIETPLGRYNPDWAVAGTASKMHLVSESKSDFTTLRDDEEAKIRCGEAHFKAIGVAYVKAISAEEIVERLVND